MPRKTHHARRRKSGAKQQRNHTVRRRRGKNGGLGLPSFKNVASKATQLAQEKLGKQVTAFKQARAAGQDLANSVNREALEKFLKEKKQQATDILKNEILQKGVDAIQNLSLEDKQAVLLDIVNDNDMKGLLESGKYDTIKSEIETEVLNDVYNNKSLKDIVLKKIITADVIEELLKENDMMNFRLKFINKFHNYKVDEQTGQLIERKSGLCKRDRISVI